MAHMLELVGVRVRGGGNENSRVSWSMLHAGKEIDASLGPWLGAGPRACEWEKTTWAS